MEFSTPKRYESLEAESPLANPEVDSRMLEFSAAWNGEYGAALMGPTGCGKSLCAAMALRRVTLGQARTWAAWVRADVVSRVLSQKDHAGDLAKLKSAHMAVIDDMGYERFPELILEVIGERYDRDLPTVITTGLKPDEFKTRYSDATIRKIVDIGKGIAVNCWGEKHPDIKPRPFSEALQRLQNPPSIIEQVATLKAKGRF